MKTALFVIFLILWGQTAIAQTVITVDAFEGGDAIWIVEKHVPITTQEEIDNWKEFIQKGQNYRYQNDLEEFRNTTDLFLRSAENFSNRSMEAENFNVSYDMDKTISGTVGIVRYSFKWKKFSRMNSEKILIGDAFSEGMVLSSDNVLIIKIPAGYEVQNVSPIYDKRDGDKLIWDGTLYRNFSKGEPAVVLSRTGTANTTDATNATSAIDVIGSNNMLLYIMVIIVIVIVLISVVLAIFRRKRHSPNLNVGKIEYYEDLLMAVPRELLELLKIPGIWPKIMQFIHKELGMKSVEDLEKAARDHRLKWYNNGSETQGNDADLTDGNDDDLTEENDASLIPSPDLTKEILGYEDMIEQYLIKSGGQAFQSMIVKESGLSKSKISIVLTQMKEEGRILKIKKGKENIIRLANKN